MESRTNGKLNSGIVTMVDATASTADLNTIYTQQSDNAMAIINGQNEQNQPTAAGTIHFVLSYRRTASYGAQYGFVNGAIYYRRISTGTWGTWSRLI